MNYVDLYTLTRSQLPSRVGDYVNFTRSQKFPDTKFIPISGTKSIGFKLAEIPQELMACKVYRMCETGKPDRLVAIDPELVDTIKFVALFDTKAQLANEKFRVDELTAKLSDTKAQLANEKFRVDELTAKLSVTEHLLDKEKANSAGYESRYNKLLYDTETIPVWKLVWNRLVNWYV